MTRNTVAFSTLICLAIAVTGCGLSAPSVPPTIQTATVQAIQTRAVETVVAQLTASVSPSPAFVSTVIDTPMPPPILAATDTPIPTATLRPTDTPTSTPTAPSPIQVVYLAPFTRPPTCGVDSAAYATVNYDSPTRGVLRLRVELQGLAPQHFYALTLNAREGQIRGIPESECEASSSIHCDFHRVRTETDGSANADIELSGLTSGDYHLKFFVKDPDNGNCIALFTDSFRFKIK